MNVSILAKAIGYILLFTLLSSPFSANAQALTAGDIAFVGYNSGGDDNFAIVVLRDITNQTIYITDREANGTSGLEASNAEGTLEWNTGATTITAGTIVTFTDVDSPSNANYGVSHGTLSTPDAGFNFAQSGDGLLAFVGTDGTAPTTFLAGIQNISNPTSDPTIGFGDTTGLNLTCAAYTITRNSHDDGGAYIAGFGTRNSYRDYLSDFKDIANWNTETSNGSDILPFPMTPMTLACTTPAITGMDRTICNKDSVLLSDLISGSFAAGVKYGTTFGVFNDTITKKIAPNTPTTYFVLDSLADSDCKDTAKIVISVNPAPVLTGKDTAISAGESVDLSTLISGILIENLSYGTTFGTYAATSTFTPTTTTTYFVNNVESTNNCSDTTQLTIEVNPQPSITTRDTTIDLGATIDLSLLVNETTTGTLEYGTTVDNLNSTNNTVSPLANTTYIIRDTVAATKCADTSNLLISINNTPNNPGILDPCNCSDPENVRDARGTVTLFHDYIEISAGGLAQTWRLAAVNSGSVLNKNGTPKAIGAGTGEVLTDLGGGRYRLDFWHLPGIGFDATIQRVSDGNMQTVAGSCSTTMCFVAAPIPTLSEWGLLILALLILNLSIFFIQSKEEVLV